jgi:hypothetical protein
VGLRLAVSGPAMKNGKLSEGKEHW